MELTKTVIFFVGFLVAICSGLPASKKDEVESVPPVRTYGDQPIVDTGVFSGWDNPFSGNPFGGLFNNLEGIMDRMRQQIASLLNRLPSSKSDNSTEDLPSFPDVFQHHALPGFGDIDLSKGNTTSITKVIDGHTVVINETEYKKEDDFGGTFFKVRIIDVKSDSSELTTEKEAEAVPVTQPPKDREEIANSIENEITKSKEAEALSLPETNDAQKSDNDRYQNIETFDEVASFENVDKPLTTSLNLNSTESVENRFSTNNSNELIEEGISSEAVDPEWSHISPVKAMHSNAIELTESDKERDVTNIDLSRDTYVNELLAKNGAPINPDAEIFMVENIGKAISPFEESH